MASLTRGVQAGQVQPMGVSFLIQLLISAVAVAGLVGLTAWLGMPRSAPPLDDAQARRVLAEEAPDEPIDRLWIAADGVSALARSGDDALIVYRAGDGYVVRSTPWARVREGAIGKGGYATLKLDDVAAPRATFAIGPNGVWPPQDFAS